MAKQSKEKPRPILRKTERGLVPVSGFDAELLAAIPVGTELDLVERSRRSLPRHRLYWQALTHVVRATEKWPTPEHLHAAIKVELGYVSIWHDLRGRPFIVADSTAFDNMTEPEFRLFFDAAMKAIAEATGADPLEFYEAAA